MEVIRDLQIAGDKFHGGVITIGNFDGLHRGHQELLKRAKALGGPLVVVTFDPHPVQVLRPEKNLRRLFPREDLVEQLPQYGVDLLWLIPFSREFAARSAHSFLEDCLWTPFRPQNIVAGYDFAFGKSREGTLEGLKDWSKSRNVAVHVVSPVNEGGHVVSSRRVRELIAAGEVSLAAELLGRPFYLRGEVISGDGRGKGLGFPTLNQRIENESCPALGVYATYTKHGGRRYRSITNIGVNPTFGGQAVKVETHVLQKELNVRGSVVDVEFMAFLRPEMKFASVEDLKKQIERDILKANEALDFDIRNQRR